MPDVVCPNCKETLLLNSSTYHWYEGEIGCSECHPMLSVKIGGWEQPRPGETRGSPTTLPVRGANGGFLLDPPRLVQHGSVFPEVLVLGVRSASIPIQVRRAMRATVQLSFASKTSVDAKVS